MAVEYDISSDVAVIKETGSVSQCARVTQMYSGQITYDDEAGSKFATATINGKSQRVMLCIAVSGTVNYDDVPSLYSTVDGHRCLNIVTPTETGTPDDVPSLYETVVIDGQNVRAVRCIMINKTPVYDGVSSTCTFTGDDGKTHTAQLVNKVTGGSVQVIIKGTSPLVLPDAIANSLSYVKAFGGTEQNGTPTPDAPVDIVSNNGVLKYGAIGKNLLNLDASGVMYGDFITDSGTVTHDNVSTISDFIPCTEGAYYTAQAVALSPGSNLRIHGYNENKNWVQMLAKSPASAGVVTTATCQIPAGIKYIKVCGYMTGSVGKDAMLELGDTATEYEPYITGIYADGTVETINVHGKNLLNPNNIHQGTIVTATGHAAYAPNRCYFDYIPVRAGDKIWLSVKNNTPPPYNIYFYTEQNEDSYEGVLSTNSFSFGDYSGKKTTAAKDGYIRAIFLQSENFTTADVIDAQFVIQNDTPTEYTPYYNGGTATAEMLLKVGDYQDEQEILSGAITRNVGVKVLDGTNVTFTRAADNKFYPANSSDWAAEYRAIDADHNKVYIMSNQFASHTWNQDAPLASGWSVSFRKDGANAYIRFLTTDISTVADFNAFLAQQYAAGTPVIVVYPLATPTTESVAGQALQVTDGDNVLEITQASLTGLELEAQYNAAVSLTIQEVQDANLDNNVTVTIQ